MLNVPDEPFTSADLTALGLTPADLRTAAGRNEIRRLLRGVYVAQCVPDSAELRIQALARVVGAGHVACDRTAAWLHGVDVFERRPGGVPPIEVCVLRGSSPSERSEIRARTRDLAAEDVERAGGVLVTTPLRTALDLGCILRRRDALAALDQFRRLYGITEQRLAQSAVRYFRRRGVVQLRHLIPLSDPRAESPRETWTRLAIIDAGIAAPVPQYEIELDGAVIFRLDHAYPDHRVAVEYDGEDFHRTDEQLKHDARRRAWLRDQDWRVIVVRKGDFTGKRLEDWLAELRYALRTAYSNLRS
jgi:hypothetical protein